MRLKQSEMNNEANSLNLFPIEAEAVNRKKKSLLLLLEQHIFHVS